MKKLEYKGESYLSETPKVFVADLASYNEGKLIGEWIDLSEFENGREVMNKINELLKKWSEEQGEEREEYIVLDFEYFPEILYDEYMGEEEFDDIIYLYNSIDDLDFDIKIINEYMSLYSIKSIKEAIEIMKFNYFGKYDSKSEFAENYIDEAGFFDGLENYLYVTNTDRRLIASEEADSFIEFLTDDEIFEMSDMKDEIDLYNERIEEINNLKEEILKFEKSGNIDKIKELKNKIYEIESLIEEEGDYYEILENAKEKLYDEIFDEWYKGLEDPYFFLVEEKGLYDKKSILESDFINIDYEKVAEELEQDFDVFYYEGEYYYFLVYR